MSLFTQTLPPRVQPQNDLQRAVHYAHWEERLGIIQALDDDSRKSVSNVGRKLAACGEVARLYLDPDKHQVRTILHRCRQRICPWCTHHRTARAKAQIQRIIATLQSPRAVVLTARSNNTPLDEQIRALRKAFKALRTSKRWKDLVTGGVYTLEVTYNPRSETWHPHVHLIMGGQFFPQALLSALWKKATRDSPIVWIKAVQPGDSAAMELAAYIGKPPKIAAMPARRLRDYVAATRGCRMLQTFGNAKSKPADDADPPPPVVDDSACITVNRIRFLAEHGQPEARALAEAIPRLWPIFERFFHPNPRDRPQSLNQPTNEERAAIACSITAAFTELLQQHDTGALTVYDIAGSL